MKVRDIIAPLEEAAPLYLQEEYDNSGLAVGDPEAEVSSALLCVDVTEAVLDEAVRLGAGLVVSHHPIIFNPLRHLTATTYIERVVAEAVKRGISLYACHTNLDSAPGFGVVGELECEMPMIDYLRLVKERLSVRCIRYSELTQPSVRRVALCTGAGASMMNDARRAGAQLYVSADFKYNNFLDADRGLVIADVGHFESEYCAIDLMYEIIRKKIATFALHKSVCEVNPVNYLV